MSEKKANDVRLPETLLTSALSSPESRAAARLLVNDPSQPPDFIMRVKSVRRRDGAGNFIETEAETEARDDQACQRAYFTLEDGQTVHVERKPGEALSDFEGRVCLLLPVGGLPRLIVMEEASPAPSPAKGRS